MKINLLIDLVTCMYGNAYCD